MRSKSRQARRKLDLWSRREYAALDGRLIEAKEERKIINELSKHVGAPTTPEKILIQRIARSLVIVSILERRVIENGSLGDLQARQILALVNSIRLGLQAIGLHKPEQQLPSVAHFLAANKGRAA
jgi:hypothetical protein